MELYNLGKFLFLIYLVYFFKAGGWPTLSPLTLCACFANWRALKPPRHDPLQPPPPRTPGFCAEPLTRAHVRLLGPCFKFIFGCTGSFAAGSPSLIPASGGYFSLQCMDFSLQWLLLLGSRGSRAQPQ